MKRRNFLKKLFQVTAIVIAITPLLVIPSIKKDFIICTWSTVTWDNRTISDQWKTGTMELIITGQGKEFDLMVKLYDKQL